MIQLPFVIAAVFRYKSRISPEQLGAGPELCPCGKKLGNFEARRTMLFLERGIWEEKVQVKHCPPCQRYFMPAGFAARWVSALSFLAISMMVWLCLATLPLMFFQATFENMHALDWEVLGAWALYGLVAGVIMYMTGRAVWRRVEYAATQKLVEVDESLGRSV